MNRLSEKIGRIARHDYFLLALIVIFAFGLRHINLGIKSFSGDEVLSLDIVKQYQSNPVAMIKYLQEIEIHPPLYYLMLNSWMKLIGSDDYSVRLFSVLFGLSVVISVFYIGKKIFLNNRIGLFGAFFTAILPMQVEYSMQARPYIIYCFVGLWHIYFLWQYIESRKNRYLWLYCLSALFGLYLHYSFSLILIASSGYYFFMVSTGTLGRKEIIKWLMSVTVIFLGFFWWFKFFLYKYFLQKIVLLNMEMPLSLNGMRRSDFFDKTFNQLIWMDSINQHGYIEIIAIFLTKILLFAVIINFILLMISNVEKRNFYSKKIFYLSWILLALITLYFFSPQSIGYTDINERHIILGSVIVAIILAALIDEARKKMKAIFLVMFFFTIIVYNMYIVFENISFKYLCRPENIASTINTNFKPRDMVMVYYGSQRSNMNHYLREPINAVSFYPTLLHDWRSDYLASRETLGLFENEFQLRIDHSNEREKEMKINYLLEKHAPDRIWLIARNMEEIYFPWWLMSHGWKKNDISNIEACKYIELFEKK